LLHHADFVKTIKVPDKIVVPRDKEYGVKEFSDIQTWLISKYNWKGTITGYDMDYDNKPGGHPTGGALTMLWHEKTGPLITASMNQYQLIEDSNMQMHTDAIDMPLTPRVELDIEGSKYMNIYDKEAKISFTENESETIINTTSRLINEKQEDVLGKSIICQVKYIFEKDSVAIKVTHNSDKENIKLIVPVISPNNEVVIRESANKVQITKPKSKVNIETNSPLVIINSENERIFNFIPGMEAIAFELSGRDMEMKISLA
jgi:hypothetical protein